MGADDRSNMRLIVRYALVGAALVLVAVWLDVEARGNGNPVSLLQPGADGPSAEVVESDFPDLRLPGGIGHDGQQFYAIARDPIPLGRSAPHLDRPQYRLQRPVYPMLGWLLHPQGGGVGLVVALLVVGFTGVLVGGIAVGLLVTRAGGPPSAALAFALLPGSFVALRITTADTLALGLGLAAVAALGGRRWWLALPLGIAAALTREPTLLVLGAVALTRRDRRSLLMAGAAGGAVVAWAAIVRTTVPAEGEQVIEFVLPLAGWMAAAGDWIDGEDWVAAITGLATIAAGVLAVLRRPRSTWTIPILVQLAFLSVLGESVVGLDYNGTRTTMPLLALAAIALLGTDSQPVRTLTSPSSQGGSGIVGPGDGSGGTSNR